MKAWLYSGARVVCVDAEDTTGLMADTEYTIREVRPDYGFHHGVMLAEALTVLLVETSHCTEAGTEYGWHVDRFRPVSTIDTTTTVEALKKLTRDAVQKVDA